MGFGRGVLAMLSGAGNALPTAYGIYRTGKQDLIHRGQMEAMADSGAPNAVTVGDTINLPPGVTSPPPASVMGSARDFSSMGDSDLARLAKSRMIKKEDAMASQKMPKNKGAEAVDAFSQASTMRSLMERRMDDLNRRIEAGDKNPALIQMLQTVMGQYEKARQAEDMAYSNLSGAGGFPGQMERPPVGADILGTSSGK